MRSLIVLLLLAVAGAAPLAAPAGAPIRTQKPPDNFRPRVEVICVDDVSVAKLGGYPFDRKWHALLVDRLVAAGARCIGFDIYFGAAKSRAGDLAFAQAIRRSGRTWITVNPLTVDDDEPRLPLAILADAARWRVGVSYVPNDLRFVGGIPLNPVGKRKDIQNMCVGLMADYLRLKRWPYPTDDGDGMVFGGWVLPASHGMFTSDPTDSRRLALDGDSLVKTHSYVKVLQRGYPMERFRGAIVVVGLTAQNIGEEVIFDNWNAPQWTFKYHVEAVGIFTEKMLRHLRKPTALPGP